MRKKIARQLPLSPGYPEHEHGRELAAMSAILDRHPEILDSVAEDLDAKWDTSKGGRPGMTAEQVLRALILKQIYGDSYSKLSYRLMDSASAQAFCRVGFNCEVSTSALQKHIKRISPESLDACSAALALFALEAGVDDGQRVRVDCTVTTTNIHKPTDSSLLWDVVRVLTRLMKHAHKHFDIIFSDRTKRAKRRAMGILNARLKKVRKKLYRDLLNCTQEVLAMARRVARELKEVEVTELVKAMGRSDLIAELERVARLGDQVVEQTRRRVLENQTVPAEEKIVSIFEEHTDIIVKDRRETLYGHKLCLTTGRSGLVLDSVVLDGNPSDSTLTTNMIERQRELYGRVPAQAAFDGAFASKENLKDLKEAGVQDVCFSKGRGLAVEDMVSSPRVYRVLRNFRAGIEGTISFLKRCLGLTRCTWSSLRSFKSYVAASVLGANLLILARHTLKALEPTQ